MLQCCNKRYYNFDWLALNFVPLSAIYNEGLNDPPPHLPLTTIISFGIPTFSACIMLANFRSCIIYCTLIRHE